jgi:hypothetical protein
LSACAGVTAILCLVVFVPAGQASVYSVSSGDLSCFASISVEPPKVDDGSATQEWTWYIAEQYWYQDGEWHNRYWDGSQIRPVFSAWYVKEQGFEGDFWWHIWNGSEWTFPEYKSFEWTGATPGVWYAVRQWVWDQTTKQWSYVWAEKFSQSSATSYACLPGEA